MSTRRLAVIGIGGGVLSADDAPARRGWSTRHLGIALEAHPGTTTCGAEFIFREAEEPGTGRETTDEHAIADL